MIYIPPGGSWFVLLVLFCIVGKGIKDGHIAKKVERTKKKIYDEAMDLFHDGELTMERQKRVTTELTMKYRLSRDETNREVFQAFLKSCDSRGVSL